MKRLTIAALSMLIGIMNLPAQSATKLTDVEKAKKGKELMAAAIEATGGIAANQKVTTRIIKGTFQLNKQPPWPMVVYEKALQLKRSEISVPNHGTVIEGCDGKIAWKQDPGQPARSIQGPQRAEKLRDARFYRGIELMSQYKSAQYEGDTKHNGILYNKVTINYADDPDMTYYINAYSYHVERMDIDHPTAGKIELEFNDNKMIEPGIVYPYELIMKMGKKDQQTVMRFKTTTVETNVDIDDEKFKKPTPDTGQDIAVP